ncbi:MAG: FG-GAP-like repeat-containing protein [Bacteroidota bacterium]
MYHEVFFLVAFNSFSQTSPLCFSEPKFRGVGSSPEGLISGDFNNDGFPDIATTNYGSDSITVLLNSGNGISFNRYDYMVGNLPTQIINADFNADGSQDLAVSTSTMLAGTVISLVYVLEGSPTGTFGVATSYTVSGGSLTIATGDFNIDGKIDLAVGGYVNTSFLDGYGDGTFSQSYNRPTTILPYEMVASDFNGDGATDLAYMENGAGTYGFNHLMVYKFGMGLNTPIFLGGDNRSITSGDFNNDGIIDLATCGLDLSFVIFGLGNGQFGSVSSYTLPGASGSGIVSVDINSDSDVDLIVLDENGYIYILYGSPTGTFAVSSTKFTVGALSMPWTIASADFDVDGKIDFVTANTNLNNVSVLLNRVKPNITINSSSNSVCIGSGVTLQVNGAYTYSWSTGDTTVVNYQIPNVDVNYSVIGTGINYCVDTQTINVFVDNSCADVWPGDANSDGVADNLDVLELGLHYTQTGAPRATTSNIWQSYFSNNWTGTITNGKNLNHIDCNGDGTINANDTLAIYNNYGLTHAFKPVQTNTVNPQLSIVPNQPGVVKGAWGTASVYLGDAINSINNINGVAFTVDFDNTLIEPSNMYIEYQNSFIDAGQNLDFRKLDFANGKIYTATTHTVNSNVSGNGKIATLHYQIKSALTTDQVLTLGISHANQSDASGAITPLTSGTGTLLAMGASVGLQELNGNNISVSPNPTNGSLTIHSKTELQKIEVVSITGALLLTETPTALFYTLNLENFANGIYFVNVYQNDRVVKREKIILNK